MTEDVQNQDLPADANEPSTKADYYRLERKIEEMKVDVVKMKQEIIYEFKAAVEVIEEDLKGANTDEISTLKDADNRLHERVIPLEHQAGIKSPEKPHPVGQA